MRKREPHNAHDCLRSFRSGKEEGFNFLFREYYAALCYFSIQITRNKETAEEIAGDSLMKLWERRENFNNLSSIRSFLYTTTRNESLNLIRQQKKNSERANDFVYLNADNEATILHQLIEAEVYREIFLALETLPPKCREIFRMFFIEHKDHSEIAKELNLSIKTVYSQKTRALFLLRQRIALTILAVIVLHQTL